MPDPTRLGANPLSGAISKRATGHVGFVECLLPWYQETLIPPSYRPLDRFYVVLNVSKVMAVISCLLQCKVISKTTLVLLFFFVCPYCAQKWHGSFLLPSQGMVATRRSQQSHHVPTNRRMSEIEAVDHVLELR
ncbi:unnamed protein product [Protopolystoma xenopodis]|uniref:Uncharacterized protein n=1 Tax=Protopolystoma xenopodis TaxID=117903 RepID=A0A448XIV6_9PLAT|nr:unnamed protein product [Protopolystoma xenopodis]